MRVQRLLVVLILLAATSGPAAAQNFEFTPYDETGVNSLDPVEFFSYLNMSRCLCDAYQGSSDDAEFILRITDSGPYTTQEVYIYLGDDCDNDAVSISEQCIELAVINHSDFNESQYIHIPVNWIVDPLEGLCDEINGGTSEIFVIMDDPQNLASAYYALDFDTDSPGVPEAVAAAGGEGAVTLTWDPPSTDDENIEYYNILCGLNGANVSGYSVSDSEKWVSTENVCGLTLTEQDVNPVLPDAGVQADAAVTADASPDGDASPVDAAVQQDAAVSQPDAAVSTGSCTGGFAEGDLPSPCFVCGQVNANTNELRLENLVNGEMYQFAVVSVDDMGNVSLVSEVVDGTPEATTDFAEAFADASGIEKGGFCFVATAVYGSYDHPDVQDLRIFRDEVLNRSPVGRSFIAWYYQRGPALAKATDNPIGGGASWFSLQGLTWAARQLTGRTPAPGPGSTLPFGLLLVGLVFGLARLAAREDEEETPPDSDADQAGSNQEVSR